MVRNEDGTPTAWKPGSNLELLLQGNSGGLLGALRVSDAWDESRRSIEARCLAPDAAASHLQQPQICTTWHHALRSFVLWALPRC